MKHLTTVLLTGIAVLGFAVGILVAFATYVYVYVETRADLLTFAVMFLAVIVGLNALAYRAYHSTM